MSVCAHDPNCPGYGADHDAQKVPGETFDPAMIEKLFGVKRVVRVHNYAKNRTLSGKKRRQMRKLEQRVERKVGL